VLQRRQFILHCLVLLAGGLLLAACASSNPIATSAPIATAAPIDTSALKTFTQRNGIFSVQVPQAWKQYQNDVPTESMAAFSEPGGRAELIAYTGLLDRRLTATEGPKIVTDLITALLNSPGDLRITDLQQRSDGAYTASLSFTRATEKRSGTAIFRAEPLMLSGVILSGPEAGWASFLAAMQPALDSFKANLESVQGTYFQALEGEQYALAIPAGWETQTHPNSKKVRSPNGQLQISAIQQAEEKALTPSELAERGLKLGQMTLGKGTLTSTEQLPDGRSKVLIDQGATNTIGYLDQKDGFVIGLFFEAPADRLADYQPLIDFIYSTYITGQ
jgi:hypothetical protein